MKKTLIAIGLAFAVPSAFAQAADIDFNGNAASACTFSSVSSGTLSVNGSAFSTSAAATYTVTNNDPGVFSVVAPQVTAFQSAPGSAAMSGDLVQSLSVVSGDNSGSAFVGSDSAGYILDLTNIGSDNISHSVSGTITNPQAGSYVVRVPVTCSAV